MTKLFNPFIRQLNTGKMNKLLGDLMYEMGTASDVSLFPFFEAIEQTEIK